MSEAGEIRYTITGDNSGLRTSLEGVNRQAEQTAQTVGSISEAISSTAESGAAAQTAINGIAASAENAAAAASAAADAVENTAQSAAVSQEAYDAAVRSQQRLSQQIQATENKLAELKAMEADMSAAQQSGDISAAAFRRYQREVQQTTERLTVLNVQNSAATERIAQMNTQISATAAVSNNAAAAVSRISEGAETAAEAAKETTRATREVGDESEKAADKSKKSYEKIGSAAKKALGVITKVAVTASAAAATAVGVLAKNAIESYGEYEQLVGGVETLFGDSADVIQGYAEEAFSTVGMSCNAYMETVTGFAASLVSSLDGDTAKAAEKANTAVSDMSDNANKMGTDLQSIQNAYQGFAKQNYTMLDNLKLGYGGTKEEMERLLAKAEEIQKTKFGIDIDYDVSSFSDIVDAIHVVQTEMGISGLTAKQAAEAVASGAMTEEEAFDAMGTTAKEASTTIQGSISTMQAAWQNLMTGIADPTQDFDKLLDDVIDSVVTVSNNLMPRIMAVLPQMATGVTQLAEGILPLIPDTLNAMLPNVIDGANSLIAALLDTLSFIADTAIPIVTENADEIIDTLITGLISAIPNLASSAADLCTALITAILDNADVITQGAVDIVIALADGISENLDTLIPAAVDAIITITETLLDPDNIDKLLTAAEDIIKGLVKGLADSIPLLIEEAPKIVSELANALIEVCDFLNDVGVVFCETIADSLVHHDWASTAETMLNNLADALDNAQKHVMLGIDDLLGGNVYGGDINNVHSTDMVGYMRDGIDDTVKIIEDGQNTVADAYDKGMQEINSKFGQAAADTTGEEWLKAEGEREANARAVLDREKKRAEEWKAAQIAAENDIQSANSGEAAGVTTRTETLEAALADLENKYAVHQLTEEEYWSGRKAALEKYRNEEDAEWWKLYDKVTEHYDKLADTEEKAAEKAKKEAETSLKNSIEDKFQELETEQLQKGYDDSWLLEQERAFIETLDHNSETYKDYNLKLLKEQKSTDEKAAKEAETAAKKQRDAVEKSYDSIVKSRDSLVKSLSSGGDIFSSSEETDKRTGAKTKKRSIDLAGFEKKIEAKKKLTSKIAELMEKNTPDDIITELLKQDPEDALAFANELLKSPDKLKKLSKGFENDTAYSNIIANMVTENSDEFRQLGTDAGTVFGEGFMAAFQANWEESFKSVFDDDYVDTAAANVTAANSYAGISANTAAANTTASDSSETAAKKSSGTSGSTSSGTYRVVDINGKYVATVVNNENARSAKTGGR